MRFSIRGKAKSGAGWIHAIRQRPSGWRSRSTPRRSTARARATLPRQDFRALAAEFVAQLRREAERGERRRFQADQWRRIVERYFVGYFADRPIHGVVEADVHRYREWRKDYWTAGPGKDVRIIPYMRGSRQIRRPVTDKSGARRRRSALRSEFVVLRLLFRFAAQQGYINTAQIPDIHLTRVPGNARP